ncbi:hypothetical protein ECANGB1_1801 [Enterospora canceri]|uniref:Brix domain-containing protein n=1 Tax=Enterospora canceri TaxID=1081671 RepID=A0A1Y1S5F9_9MICR|nr:hypothetical protein ECANGB1_1801 [Enterospora canceri]
MELKNRTNKNTRKEKSVMTRHVDISDLNEKLIYTTRKANKTCANLVKHLRLMLRPKSLKSFKETYTNEKEIEKFANEFLISHVISVKQVNTDIMLQIKNRRNSKIHKFEVVEYDEIFKDFTNETYKENPLLSFSGFGAEKEIKELFEKMHGKKEKTFKRVLAFHKEDDLIFIRHYIHRITDNTKDYVVSLKEIGPKITLKHINN